MRKNILTKTLFALTISAASAATSPLNIAVAAKISPAATIETVRNPADDEKQIFDLVNRERRKKNLNGLKWRGDLARVARDYSEKMAREKFFSHYDKNGADVFVRVKTAKIKVEGKLGENLFYYQGREISNDFVVTKWMQSASHRTNILDNRFTTAGIGVAESRDGSVYITQIFMEE